MTERSHVHSGLCSLYSRTVVFYTRHLRIIAFGDPSGASDQYPSDIERKVSLKTKSNNTKTKHNPSSVTIFFSTQSDHSLLEQGRNPFFPKCYGLKTVKWMSRCPVVWRRWVLKSAHTGWQGEDPCAYASASSTLCTHLDNAQQHVKPGPVLLRMNVKVLCPNSMVPILSASHTELLLLSENRVIWLTHTTEI